MNGESLSEYRFEPLRHSHDRSRFQCGVPELDRYLYHQAGQDARRKVAAPFVMVDPSGAIAGYYTLSAYTVRLAELPESYAKRLPRYPRLPATLVGRLAISREHRGRNLGRKLLMDALHRSLRNSAIVASIAVVVEAIDESAESFYRRHGFAPLLGQTNKMFLAMTTIEKAFKPL